MTGGWPAGVSCDMASQATTRRRLGARGVQVGRAGFWAQARALCTPGCATGPASCALGALSLF